MAGIGHVFHVEFGINDTELTRALEAGRFNEAEKLIQDNAHSSYLDEGCYQRIPLYIVLCGLSQAGLSVTPRNLHIAKVLVQYGANVNYRVPETEFGAEYLSPGKTGLELLADLYTQITLHPCHTPPTLAQDQSEPLVLSGPRGTFDFEKDMVIGLNGKIISEKETLLEDVCDLIFIMLAHGGDANIRDEYNMTLLHRAAVLSSDDRLLRILCEAGADLNALDGRKNTPLCALCDPFPFGTRHFMEEREIVYSAQGEEDVENGCNPHLDCCNLTGKEHFLDYLLSYKDVQLDVQNRLGRTALFNCVVRGDICSATLLLQHGCNPSLRGRILVPGIDGRVAYRNVTPMLAALCSNKVVKYQYESATVDRKQPSYQFLAHLVDAGYFTKDAIISELHEHMQEDIKASENSSHLQELGPRLVHLMFGATSSLRQLSARRVFDNLAANGTVQADWDQILQTLNLPKDTLVCFYLELFRKNLCQEFRQMRWFQMEDPNEDEINGIWGTMGSSDSDSLSNGGDSDLEYW